MNCLWKTCTLSIVLGIKQNERFEPNKNSPLCITDTFSVEAGPSHST